MADETPPSSPPSALSVTLRKTGFTVAVLLVAWLIFGQLAPRLLFKTNTAPPPSSPVTPVNESASSESIEMLASRVEHLEAQLFALKDVIAALPSSTPTAPPAETAATPDIAVPPEATAPASQERLALLEEKLEEQEQSLQEMQAQLQDAQEKGGRLAGAMAALGQLQEALARGEPFAAPLMQLKSLAPDNAAARPHIAQLEALAESGVATPAQLKKEFEAALNVALAPEQAHSLAGNLKSLVRIRKVGDQPGQDDESVLARAEFKLEQGDIEGSLEETAQLSPRRAEAFAGWATRARELLAARVALAALRPALMQPGEDAPAAAQ